MSYVRRSSNLMSLFCFTRIECLMQLYCCNICTSLQLAKYTLSSLVTHDFSQAQNVAYGNEGEDEMTGFKTDSVTEETENEEGESFPFTMSFCMRKFLFINPGFISEKAKQMKTAWKVRSLNYPLLLFRF